MASRKYVPGNFSLLVKRSSAGLGMFAGEVIPKDACIIEYVGTVLTEEETYNSKSKYLFEVTKNKTLDGKPKINKAGYINHSCRPNAEAVIHKQRVFIFARKKILPGEEICYDYGKDYTSEHCSPCRCQKCMPSLHQPLPAKTSK